MIKKAMKDLSNKIFISYKDDNEHVVSGYVKLIEKNVSTITIETNGNQITLPWIRVLKLKEQVKR